MVIFTALDVFRKIYDNWKNVFFFHFKFKMSKRDNNYISEEEAIHIQRVFRVLW